MKKLLSFAVILIYVSTGAYAQKQISYAQKAAEIKAQVWGIKLPEFETTAIPAAVKNESAVVLARSFDLQRTSNGRMKLFPSMASRTVRIKTFRERVKINDKAALEEFSTIEYRKKLDQTQTILYARALNVENTFIGARIIKPNGTEVAVNTDEEVLIKNEQKDQQGKLAISALQVGDIIDYYISTYNILDEGVGYENADDNNYVIFLADKYPIVNYKITFQYNGRVSVTHSSNNGAPALVKTSNTEGDQIFSLSVNNVPKYKDDLWVSVYRQLPYISVKSVYDPKAKEPAESKTTLLTADAVAKSIAPRFNEQAYYMDPLVDKMTKDYYPSNKEYKAAPLDSTMKVLYNIWKYRLFCSYDGKDFDMSTDRNTRKAISFFNVAGISKALFALDIDHDILITSSRYSPRLTNSGAGYSYNSINNDNSLEAIIRVNGAKPLYMPLYDIVTEFNTIPAEFQGEPAFVLKPKRNNAIKTEFTVSETTLPITTSDQNVLNEELAVSLMPDMQKLNISRTVKQKGHMKHSDQLGLLQMEDIDKELTALSHGQDLQKRLSKDAATKRMADDYEAAFIKARADIKKNFTAEIQSQFGQEPQQLSNYKIVNSGLGANPVFEYQASFVMDNLIKKAGNNYILEAGKLTGSFINPAEDNLTDRKLDVYMPAARAFNYTINITVPKGYTVKGIEELNAQKKNSTGQFTTSAVLNANTVKITVKRSYDHNFEKLSSWPLVLELLDAAYKFGNQKILFEKI